MKNSGLIACVLIFSLAACDDNGESRCESDPDAQCPALPAPADINTADCDGVLYEDSGQPCGDDGLFCGSACTDGECSYCTGLQCHDGEWVEATSPDPSNPDSCELGCAAMDVVFSDDECGLGPALFHWNGAECVTDPYSTCACTGDDCGELFQTVGDCQAAFATCV